MRSRDPRNERIYHKRNQLPLIDPREPFVEGDQKCGDSMNSAPQRLTDDFWIRGLEFAGGNAVIDRTAKEIEGVHARGIGPRILLFVKALGDGHHKGGAIVMRILQAEVDVG